MGRQAHQSVKYATQDYLEGASLLAAGAFLYSAWAIFGAGQEIVFWGFLLLVAGIPIFVWVKWRARLERSPRSD